MGDITLKEAINIGILAITAMMAIYSNYKKIQSKKTKDNEQEHWEGEHETNDTPIAGWTPLAMERVDISTMSEENIIIPDIEQKRPVVEIKQPINRKKHIKHIDIRQAVIYTEILKRKEL